MANDVIERYKQYLSKAQIKQLAEQAERYKLLNAKNRATVQTNMALQRRQAQRRLQNIGLASREGNIISGTETAQDETLAKAYGTYNQQLRKVEQAQAENAAIRTVRANIEAQRKAAEQRNAEYEKEYDREQLLAEQDYYVEEAKLNSRPRQQNRRKYDNELNQAEQDYFVQEAKHNARMRKKAQKEYDREMNRAEQDYFVEEAKHNARLKARSPEAYNAYMDAEDTITKNAAKWDAVINGPHAKAVHGSGDKFVSQRNYTYEQRASDEKEQAIREMSAALSKRARSVLALQNPKYAKYLMMSDDQFATAMDAAQRLYDQKMTQAQAERSQATLSGTDRGVKAQVKMQHRQNAERLEREAIEYISPWLQARDIRNGTDNAPALASVVNIAETAKVKDKQYGSMTEYVRQNQEGWNAVPWASKLEWNGQNWKTAQNKGWSAEDYGKKHDTKGSKYDALINEWSFINGRTALLYTQKFNTVNTLANIKEGIASIFSGDVNRNASYKWFRDECMKAFHDIDGADTLKMVYGYTSEREQMDAMLTLANLMTDEERARFNGMLEQYGASYADEYFEYLYNNVLPERFAQFNSDEMAFDTRNGSDRLLQSIMSVPTNILQGWSGVKHTLGTQQDDPVAAQIGAAKYNMAQAMRGAVGQHYGEVGNFLYQTGMSMADSATVGAISGGLGELFTGIGVPATLATKAGSVLGGSILGASAFNSAYDEALQKGLSPEKARLTAFGNGVNEMLFESLSLDLLVSRFKTGDMLKVSKNGFANWLVNTLVQGGVEGSEEVFTDLANNLWDKKINGIYSEELTKLREYISQGMSYDEAKRKVNAEYAEQLGMSFLGGFVSGGVMGGGASFMGMVQNRGNEKVGKGLRQNSRVMNELRNFDFKSEYAKEILQQKSLTNQDVADLFNIMQQELLGQYKSDIQKAVADGKITQEQADLLKQYEQNGVQIVKDGEVVGNDEGITVEQMPSVQDAIANLDNAARIQFLNNEEMRSLVQAVGGESAAIIDQSETVEREAEKAYRQTIAEIDADETLTDAQKKQKTAEARQTRTDARSAAASELDRTWEKHGKGVLKAETDDSGVHYVRTGKGSGKVTFDFSTYNDGKSENHNTVETMTEREKAALRIAQVVASRGVNVKVESEFTGEHRNENGYYDRKTQTIHVNLSGTNSVLWTVSHELTHHLANVNKQAYNDLRDAIRAELQKSELTTSELEQQGFDYQVADVDEYIVKTGNLWDALVQYEAEKRGYGEEAEEEVIARCCESFLANDVFIQSFAKKHFKSAKAISSFLTQMDADMNQIFTDAEIRVKMNGIRTDVSPEQQILSQVANVQEIAQKWARAVNALEKKRAAKSDGVRASRIDKQIVKISDDSDLARLIRETRDKPSKVIAQYILSVFGGQSIRMSDGREVIVDTHDAKKLSQYPKPRKTAELSSIRKIIETATLDHSATSPRHNKYKEFYYYLGDVEYNGKVYTVELNIGVTKNDGLSHLYDVRDWNKNGTADQSKTGTSMPGNAGVSITSDSTINNIPSRTDYVKHSDKESLSIVQDDDVRYSKMDDAKAGSLSGQEYLKYLQLGKKVVNKTATAEEIREFKKKMNALSQDNREAFLDRLREKRIRDDEGAKVREQRLKRDLRITALKWNQRLVKMLANPTEASHIPVQLAQEVAEFTKALTEYMDGGTERGRLNLDKIMIAYQRAFDNQITIEEAQRENPNYDPRGSVIDGEMYDKQLEQMINDLNVVLQSKSIEELNSFELNELLNIVRGVTYTVYEANRMIGTSERKAIWEVGDKMVSELETAPKVSGRWYLEKSLDLRRMAKIFSGSNEKAEFVKLVDQLNEGAIEKERVAQALQSIFTPVTERYGDEIRNWYGKNAEWIDTGIKKGDKKIEITKGMRVSLALHVLNAGNMRHIQRGGLTIPNRELYRKGKLQDAYANGELVRLKAEQINEIISHMTEAEKAYVEAAKNLFHKRTGYYVNRTSLKLLGYRKAIVENYFPIHTNKNFTKTDFASLKMDGSIEGQGFLKERAGSSNPVYLEDITSVVNRQIRGVALYAGLAIPMRNFNAVMNASIYEDDNGVWSPKTTVKEVLTKKMGAYGAKVVEGFLTDVSEMSHVDVTPFAGKLATNYVKAVLLGNLKVAMKQVASYPTAAAVIPWKYLGKALFKGGRSGHMISRADVDLINQYTPLYQIRREGQANEIASIMAKRGLEQKLPWLLGWITKMDVMTVGRLWSAAEYMVADQQKNLPVGSDAYYKAVAKVFNDTVQQTQPNFTPLQRNAVLRSKNPIERSLVLFGTQRMQNGGILIEALYELKHSKGKSESEIRAAKQKLGRAVASQVVQNILLIVASLGVDALRGRMKSWQDDDKEITVESLAKGMGDMFLSNFVGSFLGGSEVYDLISTVYKKATGSPAYGANFTIPAIDALEYLYDTVGNVVEFINYVNEGHSVEEKLKKAKSLSYDLAKAFGYATGIPLENAVKDLFKGIIPAIQDLSDWKKTGELIPWLHQSGKLDQKKTSERYKEWTNLGKSGREFFYWDNKMKGITKRDDRIAMLANENIPNEEKAMLVAMFDTSGAYAEGTKVYRSNGKEYYDFASAEPISPIESTLNEIEEATAAPTAEPTATPNPLSEAKQEGVQQAVAQGVPEQTANEAFLTYQNMGKNHDDGYSKNDDFRAWLFTNVTDSHQRAVLEYQVIGKAAKVKGSVTYRESGVVWRDFTNEYWYKLSNRDLAKDGTNKRYEAGKRLEKTGLSVDKTVAIYDGLKDLTKKAEWTEYLKKQGLTNEQINIFLWSRGWAK